MSTRRSPLPSLSCVERSLLSAAVERHQPMLKPLLITLGSEPLSDDQREHLREALADELLKVGLSKDGEPNPLGVKIDDLIGKLSYF